MPTKSLADLHTNAAYGFLKNDHSYVVGIEKRGDVPVPAECDCPADVHGDQDCKHKVALATVGGTTVLNAATKFTESPAPFPSSSPENVTTGADKIQADGGAVTSDGQAGDCPNGDTRCDGPDGDVFPCFDCFEVRR